MMLFDNILLTRKSSLELLTLSVDEKTKWWTGKNHQYMKDTDTDNAAIQILTILLYR
jgi:hypothetical protein